MNSLTTRLRMENTLYFLWHYKSIWYANQYLWVHNIQITNN